MTRVELRMSTAAEILDKMEPGETVDELVVDCMAFTICSECGHVDEEEQTLTNHPCQKCGVIVDGRRILFSTEERLLEMIFEAYQSKKPNEVCVLLW